MESLIATSQSVKVYGLVLAGGRSKRMNRDKSLIDYHGKPQVEHCFSLLSRHCSRVFVSARHDQADSFSPCMEQISDLFVDSGPIGGILSAMTKFPKVAWLVVACDLPLLTDAVLAQLLEKRNPFKVASCFLDPESKLPEPLCAVYEPKASIYLADALSANILCPRVLLRQSPCAFLSAMDPHALRNANWPSDYEDIKRELRGSGV